MNTLQHQQELIDNKVEFQRIDPETSNPIVTQRDDLVFFSNDGMVYRRYTDQYGNKVWLLLSNVLNAVGWYHVESPFVHTVNDQVAFNSRSVNIYGETHVNAYPGEGSVFKMSDVTYSTSPSFSFQEYNTIALPIGDRTGPLLQEFNKREWIYLYLKDDKHKLVGYTYPLVPWVTGRDHPWQVVPDRVYDPVSGLPTGTSYHDNTFFNSALVENLPIFCPTSYGKYPTSYEVNGFNGWTDLTQHQDPDLINQESQTPDKFDAWQTVEQEIDNEVVQSVVDHILSAPDEGVDETGFTTPDPLSDSGVSSSSSSSSSPQTQVGEDECPVARQLEYGSPSPSSVEGSVSSYTSSSESSYVPSEYSSEYTDDDWAYDQGYGGWDPEYRRDPFCGEWFTKSEFVEYYGDSSFWHMLSPEKEAERFMIETVIMRNRSLLTDKNVNHLLTKMLKTFM